MSLKRNTNAFKILKAYRTAGTHGLTAEAAAYAAEINLRSCYWKRVSELVQAGYLRPTNIKRAADSGRDQRVNRITAEGRAYLKSLTSPVKTAA